MSIIKIRAALETALNNMSPSLQTSWENVKFEPTIGTPYQRCHLLLGEPDNSEYGPNYMEQGTIQIDLFYPLDNNSLDAMTRAELIRDTFYRGNTFINGGISVTIRRTPEIAPAYNDGEFYITPVLVRFFVHINT
jgi:Bacteriophage related domain of unknown function